MDNLDATPPPPAEFRLVSNYSMWDNPLIIMIIKKKLPGL